MENTVAEFKKIKAKTWALSKPWIFILILAIIIGFNVGDLNENSSPREWTVGLISFALFCMSIIRLTFIVRAQYRCPACGEVPMSGWASFGPSSFGFQQGVDLNPHVCPKCGVKLK